MPRKRKSTEDSVRLDLPKPTAKSRNFTKEMGNNNQINHDGTRKGGDRSGLAPVETLDAYKTWMQVQGIKRAFIAAYSECGNVIMACNIAGVHPTNVYKWKDSDPVFQEDLNIATDMAVSILEHEARRRALEGSDRLLEFLLKSVRPEIYRERYEFKQEIHTDYIIDISPRQPEGQEISPPRINSSSEGVPGESS